MAAEPMKGPRPADGRGPASGSRAGESSDAIGLPEIPGYRIEETLGRGATGVVFRATQLAVEREVALKILHPDLAGRPRAVRRLQREARTAARLAHPNIVTAIDMGQTGGLWWYAMELVVGESLAERFKRTGRLSEREALRLFAPLVDALDHAFRQGVVHRDIKPANILIDSSGRPRLVDLGLAFREEDPMITKPGGTLGTPHYVSPEQARNPQAADARSDIWSLGATMYHAVCGRPPFAGGSVAEILSAVLYGRVIDPLELEPRLSRGFSLMLRKCLSRSADGRYQTPHELLGDLERLREKRQVSVRVKGLDPVRREHFWRPRVLWGALAAVLVVTAGVLIWSQVSDGPVREEENLLTPAVWPELEELARGALDDDRKVAATLAAVVDLAPVPMRHRPRYEAVEEDLTTRFRELQKAFHDRVSAEIQRRINERDFVAAQALVGSGLVERVREEFQPANSQFGAILERVRAQELADHVESELDSYVADLWRRIEAHFEVEFARVERDQAAGRWRKAHDFLARDPIELLSEADVVSAGLPQERVEELEDGLRDDLDRRTDLLESAWRALDVELVRQLEDEAERLEEDLRKRRGVDSAEAALRESLDERYAALDIDEDQRLVEVANLAPRTLERLAGKLRGLQTDLLEEDARNWLVNERKAAVALERERRYDELVAIWGRALEVEWLAPVREQVALELAAARLLEDLLARAARGLSARDGQEQDLLVGSILRSGRLEVGEAPLEVGFRLVTGIGPPMQLALRTPTAGGQDFHLVVPETIEEFAGLPAEPGENPADDLARALMRMHHGDGASARRFLPARLPADTQLAALTMRLSSQVERAEDQHQLVVDRRQREAGERLNVVLRAASSARHAADTEAAARDIDELLARYGDVELVRSEADELRRLRAELLSPPGPVTREDLVEAFGPTSVVLSNRGEAEMRFDFGSAYDGRWSRGDWRADGTSWFAPDWRSLEQVFSDKRWPRLVLRPPVDLDGTMRVSFTFEQPRDSGPPQLLVASVAGVHVVLRHAEGEPARLGIGSGDPAALRALVEEIELGDEGQPFDGLKRGERYTLSVELERKRGKAIVRLTGARPGIQERDYGGRELGRQEFPRPEGKPGTASLVLRSLEPIRLLEARVVTRVE